MNAKLTLRIEQEIIKKAKAYAKAKNSNLTDIMENYLKLLTKEEKATDIKKLNPVVKSLRGSFKMPKRMDYKKELKDRLDKKYLFVRNGR